MYATTAPTATAANGEDRRRAPGRTGGRDLVVDLDFARKQPPQLGDLGIERAEAFDDMTKDGQGLRRGVADVQAAQAFGDRDGFRVTRQPLVRRRQLGAQDLGPLSVGQHGAPPSENDDCLLSGDLRGAERGPVGDKAAQCRFTGVDGSLRSGDRIFGYPKAARVALASHVEIRQDRLELTDCPRGVAVCGADRRRQSVAQIRLVAIQVLELAVADQGCRPEECGRWQPGQIGEHLVHPPRLGGRLAVERQPRSTTGAERLAN